MQPDYYSLFSRYVHNLTEHPGGELRGLCPFHDDSNPSWTGNRHSGLWRCFGCGTQGNAYQFAQRVGERLEADNGRGEGGTNIPLKTTATVQPSPGCTLEQYAKVKKLPIAFLRGVGLSDISYTGSPAVRIPYFDAGGTEVAVRFRLALSGEGRFRWKSGTKPILYGLWRSDQARKANYVVLVEGESDCHTLWHHDIPAMGIPGADNWREDRDAEHFDGIATVYVVIEPDRGGETLRQKIATSCIRDRVRLVDLSKHKDPSGLYLADPDYFLEHWQAALEVAVPWGEQAAAEASTLRQEVWALCKELAHEPRILDRFSKDLALCGVVGEDKAAKLLYLAVTSRLLERPVSAAVRGPSAGGKSYLVERVLGFFPDSACYVLSAMSERALAYSEEPLSHRFLVVYEAVGLQSDFASYLVRSLLSEGRVRYETVEKTRDGLQPRLIEREGPTGLLVTTTALKLHPENETRLLSLTITDTSEQTKKVLLALAEEDDEEEVDLTPWHALQAWLKGGEHRVTIPYAKALAEKIPPVAVRLRRDFGAILNLIRAHALLHQATRRRDAQGRIIATLDDYTVLRELVADLVAEGVETTVSPTIRETVEAIAFADGASEVTVLQLARRLNLDKTTTWRRVRAAIDRGYLKNLEDKKGRPARLVLGDPLPDNQKVLPDPETLSGCSGCRVAVGTEGIDTPPYPQDAEGWEEEL